MRILVTGKNGYVGSSLLNKLESHFDFTYPNFIVGVGRDDLPSGRSEVHWESLKVLNNFSDNLMVYSGHDPPSTVMKNLGWNRLNNPVLNLNNFEEYLSWQKKQWKILGEVKKIKTAIPANIFADTSSETN